MSKEILLERYWLEQLQGPVPQLSLPVCSRDTAGAEAKQRFEIEIPEKLLPAIGRLTNNAAIGRFCCFAAGLAVLLHRYTGEEDILLAVPPLMAGKEEDKENVCFLRQQISGSKTIGEILVNCREKITGLYTHQSYNYETLLERLTETRQTTTGNLFQAGLVDESVQEVNSIVKECGLLFIFTKENPGKLVIAYSPEYAAEFIDRLGRHYIILLEQLCADVKQMAGKTELLGEAEKDRLLYEFNDTASPVPLTDLITLFRQSVSAIPDDKAVAFGNESLSYSALDQESDSLAACLVREKNIAKGDIVAVCLESSFGLIVTMLAVLKAGAVIMPVVPGDNESRVNHLLTDSRSKILVTEKSCAPLTEGNFITLFFTDLMQSAAAFSSKWEPVTVSGNDDAYIIYTSGSTGKPKGTRLSHDNIICMMTWYREYFNISPVSVFPQKTTIGFVDSVVELLLPVTLGRSCVYLRPYDTITWEPEALFRWLKEIRATIMQFVPSVFENFIAAVNVEELTHLQTLIVSGEQLRKKYSFRFDTYNLYGCSEATASSTVCKLTSDEPVSIGHPVGNTTIYILDEHLRLLPQDVIGEIYISGRFLSAGYLHNEALTSERFIPNPFRAGELMYKTSDRGRWLSNKNIEYHGRADDQFKLRGMRIEPAEIEKVLLEFNGIKKAFVLKGKENEEELLMAYLLLENEISLAQLKAHLRQQLPAHMIPAVFMSLPEIPYTSSGKLNRNLLPGMQKQVLKEEEPYIAPTNETEEKLAQVWQDVLQAAQPVSIDSDFMDMGGHSLKAIRVVSRIEKEYGTALSLKDFFQHGTVRKMAEFISTATVARQDEIIPVTEQPFYELSHAQKRLWILSQLETLNDAYNMSHTYLYKGELNIPALQKTVETIIRRHESLRTVFLMVEGEPKQKVLAYDPSLFSIRLVDLREETGPVDMNELVSEEIKKEFDLGKGPLIRVCLFRYNEEGYAFTCTLHHIITDGWSMQVLMQEIRILYKAFAANENNPLPPLAIQYRDYCHWHNRLLNASGNDGDKYYWTNKLGGDIPVLQLPVDYPRKDRRDYQGGMIRSAISSDLTAQLNRMNKTRNVTMFVSLVAFVKILLYKYSGQQDVLVGSPIAGRNRQELENQVGFFLNNLVLRDQLSDKDTFSAVLQKVKQTVLDAFDHQLYPYDRIIEDVKTVTPPGHNPLYDVMVVMAVTAAESDTENSSAGFENVEGLQTEHVISKLDLSFFFSVEDRINTGIEYRTDLFKEDTIRSIHSDLEKLINLVLADPDITLTAIRHAMQNVQEKDEQEKFADAVTDIISDDF